MPTALELPRDKWHVYLKAARQRRQREEISRDEQREREQLLTRVVQATELLKEKFGVRRVILFGSLAHANWFTPTTDIDLAVEGLRHDDFWQAWQFLEEVFPDRRVDLITLETASKSLKAAIKRQGVEL